MTHKESKKQAKPQNNKSRGPEVIHNDDIEKQKSKGVIRGE